MRKVTLLNALFLLSALTCGNFVYEWMHLDRYDLAIRDSFFQGVALLLAWFFWREPS